MSDNDYSDNDIDSIMSDEGHHTDDEEEEKVDKEEEERDDDEEEEGVAVDTDFNFEQSSVVSSRPDNTLQYLTRWEVARLLHNRVNQINQGYDLRVPPIEDEKPCFTAIRELKLGRMPLMVKRLDIATGVVTHVIDPNSINPMTGQRWFNESDFNFGMKV